MQLRGRSPSYATGRDRSLRKIEDIRQERIAEQIVDATVPRAMKGIIEDVAEVPVPQIQEQTVEVFESNSAGAGVRMRRGADRGSIRRSRNMLLEFSR